jgi:glycosyltransferase involved in cell wall biosynthesis
MRRNVLLTIAIPTYNRSKSLEQILIQLGKQKDERCVILLSDDASPDDTEQLVGKYKKILPNLIYHRNNKNLGYSGNVCKLYELANSQYIWFLCDDDTVLPNAVKNIIGALIKYHPVVAVFNCTWINPYGQKVVAGVKKDIFYTRLDEIKNYQSLQRLTYLSIIVVEKKLSLETIKKTDYRDNIFFQLTLGIYLLSDNLRFVEVAFPIVHRNVGYKYGEFFKFYLVDSLKAVFSVKHVFDNGKFIKWSKNELLNALMLYLSQKLGLFSYNNKPTGETRKLILRYYGPFYGLIIFSFPLISFSIPTFLLKSIYRIRLIKIHGRAEGNRIYRENINRVYYDTRKTKFTNYK